MINYIDTFAEPQLGTNQDHLVRKIFSKFRRTPQPGPRDGQSQSDVEKGDNEPERGKVSVVMPSKCSHVSIVMFLFRRRGL